MKTKGTVFRIHACLRKGFKGSIFQRKKIQTYMVLDSRIKPYMAFVYFISAEGYINQAKRFSDNSP